MFVRLFFAGGPIDEELMLGSSWPPAEGGRVPEGPDIARNGGPGARRLFRAPLGREVSSLTEASARVG